MNSNDVLAQCREPQGDAMNVKARFPDVTARRDSIGEQIGRSVEACAGISPRGEPQAAGSMQSFPFTAIVGQDEMRTALLIAAVEPAIGGVLVLGDRGTGKSTAVRALASLLPPIDAVAGFPYACEPAGKVR